MRTGDQIWSAGRTVEANTKSLYRVSHNNHTFTFTLRESNFPLIIATVQLDQLNGFQEMTLLH